MAFGVPWFGFVALAQIRLTDLEGKWSTEFTLVVFGGGLAFVVSALLAAGTARARGAIHLWREDYDVRRLVALSLLLLLAGAAGVAYKAHVLHGIPLLSDNPDVVRARANTGGESAIPAWSSALTDGLFLSMWAALAALWTLWGRAGWLRGGALVLLAAVGLFGASLEASRNIALLALAVPAIAVYLMLKPGRRLARAVQVSVGVAVAFAIVVGAFVLRVEQNQGAGQDYLSAEMDRQPPVLRPLLPLYINGAFPLEAERRLADHVPERESYALGGFSFASLPDAFFPEGKPAFGTVVGELMRNTTPGEGGLTWTVASYQGRLYGDLGPAGVILGSILLGLGFGRLYRFGRRREGFLALAVVAYGAYYAAFMVYDNLLSFTIIAAFDMAVIFLADQYLRDEGLRAALSRLLRAEPQGA